jgi:repressor LexA
MGRTRRNGLGERQLAILRLLERYQAANGYPPSIREMAEYAGIPSTSVVNYYLNQLVKTGYIERDPHIPRGIRLVKQPELAAREGERMPAAPLAVAVLRIPVLGRIVAGLPLPVPASDFSLFDPETILDLPASLLPEGSKDLYALEVQGDSMIDALVHDGDMVILKRAEQAKNGEMVAAWIKEGGETTLKYFYREKGRIRLQPANPAFRPIYIDQPGGVEIQGKVVMVIRRLPA